MGAVAWAADRDVRGQSPVILGSAISATPIAIPPCMELLSALWKAIECHHALHLRRHERGRAGYRPHTRPGRVGFLSDCAGDSSLVRRAGYGVDSSDQYAYLCVTSTG